MMRRKLNQYFQWKTNFSKSKDQLFEKKPEENNEDGIRIFFLSFSDREMPRIHD